VINPGVRHGVTCRECGASGRVRVKASALTGARCHVEDYIPHLDTCSLYKRAQPRHLKKKQDWQKQEKRANALVGARETVASGAANEDGDGRLLGKWRTESKQTKRTAYALYQTVWSKLVDGALGAGEEPLLHVQMKDEKRVAVRKEWYDAMGGDQDLVKIDANVNPKSYKIDGSTKTPQLIQLDPPGVLLFESEFSALKGEES